VTPHVAAGSLAAGFGVPQRLGGPVRDVNGLAPLFLADGRAALAWTDNTGGLLAQHAGRLHVAVDGAPPATPAPAPELRVRAAGHQRLFTSQGLKVQVGCAAACDVRATLRSRDRGAAAITRTLRAGRAANLELAAPGLEAQRRVRVRMLVTATAPDGHRRTTISCHIVLVRRPTPPVPAPLGVRARRSGRSIVVTWHTAFPARQTIFSVVVGRSRQRPSGTEVVRGHGRTHFRARVRPRGAGPIRLAWIAAFGLSGGRTPPITVVPVR
jgi:hypothetical protein